MKLESFKSELFNNEIKKPELIVGGISCTQTEIIGIIVDNEGCEHLVIQGYRSDNCNN